MITVDTNIIVCLFIPGEYSALSENVFEKDSFWIAPLLWQSEFRSVLAKYMSQRSMSLSTALKIGAKAQELLQNREFPVSNHDVLPLGAQSQCSTYDCEFVAVAQAFQTHLVTFDRQILKNFPAIAIHPENFISMI